MRERERESGQFNPAEWGSVRRGGLTLTLWPRITPGHTFCDLICQMGASRCPPVDRNIDDAESRRPGGRKNRLLTQGGSDTATSSAVPPGSSHLL